MFKKTNEKAIVTFNGWDGKSYNGEPCKKDVYVRVWMYKGTEHTDGKRFVRTYDRSSGMYDYHFIMDECHPVTGANLVFYCCSDAR